MAMLKRYTQKALIAELQELRAKCEEAALYPTLPVDVWRAKLRISDIESMLGYGVDKADKSWAGEW
jgi:hypothetical protein